MAGQQSLTSLLTLMGAYREELDYTVLSNLITVIFFYLIVLIEFSAALFKLELII